MRELIDSGLPVGSGGSRLLRGNHPEHEAVEEQAARFFGSESALFFSCGFAANSALFGTLPQRGDAVFCDELVHASTHEGLRLGRAETVFFGHNEVDALERVIREWRGRGATGTPWIAVESLYSMDGDFAPLAELARIAEEHDAILVVDEAHATGVFGPQGRGLVAELPSRENIVTLHTCGKALGCEGALLCGPRVMREHLVNRARNFIFSTAPSPLVAALAGKALEIIAQGEDLRAGLRERIAIAERLIAPLGVAVTGSPIMPFIIGADRATMMAATMLQAAGYDVRGIRPPTVPQGTARLRIVITLNATLADIEGLAEQLGQIAR